MPGLTDELAQRTYAEASEALKAIVSDPDAPDEAKVQARARHRDLNREYIGKATRNIEQRTRAFAAFTDMMTGVLATLQSAPALEITQRLTRIVEEARAVLEEDKDDDRT